MLQTFLSDVTSTFLDQYDDTNFETMIHSPDFEKHRDKLYDCHKAKCKRS